LAQIREQADRASILTALVPGAHAIGHTFIKVRRTHRRLNSSQLHSLSYLIAHAGEGKSDTLALELTNGVEQSIAGARVNEVYRARVDEYVRRRRAVWRNPPGWRGLPAKSNGRWRPQQEIAEYHAAARMREW
jgi:hypothetical protein